MKSLLPLLLATSLAFTHVPEQKPFDADLFKQEAPAFSLHGSVLFWRVQEGALDYALKMKRVSPSGTVYAQGDYQTATFNGEPGFRIAASYFRAPKYWELWAQYTRICSSGTNSVINPDSSNQYLTGTFPHSGNPLTKAKSHIEMKYNTFDWLIDRVFIPNPHLRLRLLGGATVAWTDQDWNIRYFDRAAPEALTQIQNKWDFVGGGLRFGTMIDWYFGYDVYLTVATTFASVLGSYHNKTQQTNRHEPAPVRDTRYHDVRPAFSVQTLCGFSWQKNFFSKRMEFFGGYELNSWFNLQEIYRSSGGSPEDFKETGVKTSAIALHGLTVRATLDF